MVQESSHQDLFIGSLAATISVVSFSAAAIIVKFLVSGLDPIYIAAFRYGIPTFLYFLGFLFFSPKSLKIDPKKLFPLFLVGFSFFGVYPVAFNFSLKLMEASQAVIFMSTVPLWSAIISKILFGEKNFKTKAVGVLVSISGLVILEMGNLFKHQLTKANILGAGLMLLCAFIASGNAVSTRKLMKGMSLATYSFYTISFGVALLIPTALLFGKMPSAAQFTPHTIELIAFLGCVPGMVGFYLRYMAVIKIGPVLQGVFNNLIPIFAAFFAWLFLHEKLSGTYFVAMAFVITGMLIVTLADHLKIHKNSQNESAPRSRVA